MEALFTTYAPEMIPYTFCDCNFFSKFMMNIISTTLSQETKSSIWITFEKSLEQYSRLFTVPDGPYSMIPCSKKFSLVFLVCLEELRQSGGDASLSTLINTVVSVIYLRENDCCYNVRHFENLIRFCGESSTVQLLAALRGRSVFMKLLLTVGLVKNLPEQSAFLYREAHKYIRDFISLIIANQGRELNFFVYMIMKVVQHSFLRSKNLRCYKRIFLASVVIKAIQLKLMGQRDLAYEYVSCLRMYFTATSDPLLSVFEVKSLLYGCCTIIKGLRYYDKFCQEFDSLMPQCPARLEPRKLTDLARCQVRQNLSKCNVLLPVAVENLDIPNRVKRFILGDLIDISGRKKFTIISNRVEIIE